MADDSFTATSSTDERPAEGGTPQERWLPDENVLDADLPDDVQMALGRFLGTDPVETLGEWAATVRTHVGGGSITVDELCLTDRETAHSGRVDGETYHFACFYDAVIMAAVTDRPVDVRTRSPGGTVIEARAVGTDELRVSPREAAFSFGIDRRVEPPSSDGPSLEASYAAICPYVRAFPTREAYERWAATVPAATVATPLVGATELAAALVE